MTPLTGSRFGALRRDWSSAGLSKGNIYRHFLDKETIFRELLDHYFQLLSQPDFPFNQALASGTFPENLEALDIVRDYREYVSLIYVDVVELDAAHVRKFYAEMAARFETFLKTHDMEREIQSKLARGLSPTSAVIHATRVFMNYFTVEILFGVKNHFGKSTDEVVTEITHSLRHGMLRAQ